MAVRAEAVSNVVTVRLSPMELRRACEAAQVCHLTVSAFVRDAIVEATSDCLEPLPSERPRVASRRRGSSLSRSLT